MPIASAMRRRYRESVAYQSGRSGRISRVPSLRIAQERDANAVLRGSVVAYKNQVFGYTTTERATEYEIVLTVSVTFRDMVKNRDLWKDDALTVRTTYNVTAVSATQPAQTEADGRKDVIQKLTDRIVSRTVQGW